MLPSLRNSRACGILNLFATIGNVKKNLKIEILGLESTLSSGGKFFVLDNNNASVEPGMICLVPSSINEESSSALGKKGCVVSPDFFESATLTGGEVFAVEFVDPEKKTSYSTTISVIKDNTSNSFTLTSFSSHTIHLKEVLTNSKSAYNRFEKPADLNSVVLTFALYSAELPVENLSLDSAIKKSLKTMS
ncbi:MAG: hypothetical protein A3H06_02255 [Candidatus Colwellbacteria bacterium RIFCSPLOWO2_12_FULL_44_13]|uniref:Uncharacterized protein n=2 Tax=Candidatus Colwelliibacteriota TaxID=1817904 RepID=A0A1G1Z3I5_9BACT|nr:MAG: hypothetical protein A3F24_01325 [Candidatus Colwellbacteria bacterium RIFCSPHIGHO2_12_FULL_44_17]OGY61769.1 MAG: hypothetical protein A3H06_02255 [Candidatus Colwellbacteria bacterium RIFCSPLOWO2_12_FULL_44_13]